MKDAPLGMYCRMSLFAFSIDPFCPVSYTHLIILFGHIKGNIKSKEVILKSTCSVQGDIVADAVEIEMGSRYDGNLKISHIEAVNKDLEMKSKTLEMVPLNKKVEG